MKKICKRVLSVMISVVLVTSLLPQMDYIKEVKAEEISTECGDFTVIGGTLDEDDTFEEGGVLTIISDEEITIKNTDPETPTTDYIEVAYDVNARITLAGVNIDRSRYYYNSPAFKIADDSTEDVTITLADDTNNILKSGTGCAGLEKNGDTSTGTLTIIGNTGTLTATGGYYGAGIGAGIDDQYGTYSKSASNITIRGGEVTATGGSGGAGIGGVSDSNGSARGRGSNITIINSKVTATGGSRGAGIGGGYWSDGSDITISGSEVTATGGDYGAGIGGGSGLIGISGNGSNITIIDSKVTARGSGGAGIGGGYVGNGNNIRISGSIVTATVSDGSYLGSGIGGGPSGSGSDIIISDSCVVTRGRGDADGIPGGPELDGIFGDAQISDSLVIDGDNGTVVGNAILRDDFTIDKDVTLEIEEDATLTVGKGTTLTNDGTINVNGELINDGTIVNNGIINIKDKLTNNGTITNDGTIDNNGSIAGGGSIDGSGTIKGDGTVGESPEHNHKWSEKWSSNSTHHWKECTEKDCDITKNSEKGEYGSHKEDEGTVTKSPTKTEPGIMTYKCSICGHERTEEIDKLPPSSHTHKFGTEWKTDGWRHWHECSCGEKSDIARHTGDNGTVTKAPTETEVGIMTYKCAVCGYVLRLEKIEKLDPKPGQQTPQEPGQPEFDMGDLDLSEIEIDSAGSEIMKEEKEQNELQLNQNASLTWNGKGIVVKWGKVKDATHYKIYATACSTKYGQAVATVNAGIARKLTVKKLNGKTINPNKIYKVQVAAYRIINGKEINIATSKTMHIASGTNKKYTNAASIQVKKNTYQLKKGKTATIKATIVKQDKKKKLLPTSHGAALSYTSSNKRIATVTKKGKIKAKKKGTCYIYIQALNGKTKKIKVEVK